jgi:hypothetical protein
MKPLALTLLMACATLAAGDPSPAFAKPVTIFECHLPAGKWVTVTQDGDQFTYRHGTAHGTDLTITGNAHTANLFYWSGRYTNIEQQLRFTKGDYSYIVYSLGPNPNLGADGDSGIEVLKGTNIISDTNGDQDTCSPWADLNISMENDLPEDDQSWSAM